MNDEQTIWILEDDICSQFAYQEILGSLFHIISQGNCKEFLTAVENCKTSPKLVIADLRLPDDSFLSCLSVPAVMNFFSAIPFIVVSSVDEIDALRLCFSKGALDYLIKPFTKNELLVKIEKALSQNTMQPQKVEDSFFLEDRKSVV